MSADRPKPIRPVVKGAADNSPRPLRLSDRGSQNLEEEYDPVNREFREIPDSKNNVAVGLPRALKIQRPPEPVYDLGAISAPRPVIKTAADDTVARLMKSAATRDPALALDHRLRAMFQDAARINSGSRYLEWAETELKNVLTQTSRISERTQKIVALSAADWIRQTQEASTRVPSLLDRFTKPNGPGYYKTRLEGIRRQLLNHLKESEDSSSRLDETLTRLRLRILSLTCLAETLSDTHSKMVADTRVRTLVGAQGTGVTAAAQNMQTAQLVMGYLQTIDELVTQVIPNWQLAESRK